MGKLEPGGLRCGGTFILCYLLSEIVLLVHTEGLGRFISLSSVGMNVVASTVPTICDQSYWQRADL